MSKQRAYTYQRVGQTEKEFSYHVQWAGARRLQICLCAGYWCVENQNQEHDKLVQSSKGTSSHTSEKQMGDATLSIELAGAHQQIDMDSDVAGRADSVRLEENAKAGSSIPKDFGVAAGTGKEKNADCTSQIIGDHNDSCGSSTLPFTALDHSMPTILEIQSDLRQQFLHTGTQNQERKVDLNPVVEVENDSLQPLEAGQLGQIISQDPSPDSHEELSILLYRIPKRQCFRVSKR